MKQLFPQWFPLNVSEVAAEVGFADQSHLHRHFKRMFGITPKAVLAG